MSHLNGTFETPESLSATPLNLVTWGDSFALILNIKGRTYHALPLPTGADGEVTVRVSKAGPGDDVYDVTRGPDGLIVCTCQHYEFRLRGNSANPCKHGKAIDAAGLFDAYRPALDPSLHPASMSTRVRNFAALPDLTDAAGSDARWAGLAAMAPLTDPDDAVRSAEVVMAVEREADRDDHDVGYGRFLRDWDIPPVEPTTQADRDGWLDALAREDAMAGWAAEDEAEREREERGSGQQFPDWPEAEIVYARGERVAAGREG